MANNCDTKTIGFTITLPGTTVDLLDWLCSEQEEETNRSKLINSCIESFLHEYVLKNRPDLAKQTCIVKKQAFFRELSKLVRNGASG